MKKTILIILVLATTTVEARTIEKSEYVGLWRQYHGPGLANSINKLISKSKNTLEISPNYAVTLTRVFDNHTSVFVATPDNVYFENDLLIIKFTPKGEGYYKFVLNGWVVGSNTQIFGMVYHYEDGELINGVPLSFLKDR